MIGSRAILIVAWLSSACSVTALAEREKSIAINSCEDGACSTGSCVQNQCVSRSGTLSTLLFALSPRQTGDYVPSQIFSVRTDVPKRGSVAPLDRPYRLSFAAPTSVSVRVVATAAIPEGCKLVFVGHKGSGTLAVAPDGSIPARMTFQPVERWLGLSGETRTLYPSEAAGAERVSYDVEGQLAPGRYDIYVEPYALSVETMGPTRETDCSVPPFLLRNQDLTSSEVILPIELPKPSDLELTVETPDSLGALNEWTAQVLEPSAGKPISSPIKLDAKQGTAYVARLRYLSVVNETAEGGAELVRLAAPANVVAPALLYERKSLELFTPGVASINQLKQLPKPVTLGGSVLDASSGEPLNASLSFLATSLLGMEQLPVAFSRQLDTDKDGNFRVELLPGTYEVRATPSSSPPYGEAPYATINTMWEVAQVPVQQEGRALVMGRAGVVKGTVLVPNADAAAQGAAVVADVSPVSLLADAYSKARIQLPPASRASGSAVDENGGFELFAEPGVFDVSVQPPAESGFPWLVIPGLDLSKPRSEEIGTEPLLLQQPVRLDVQGAFDVDYEYPLASASIRVFALLDEKGVPVANPADARAAVSIAQGRLDSDGLGRLLLPESLTPIALP